MYYTFHLRSLLMHSLEINSYVFALITIQTHAIALPRTSLHKYPVFQLGTFYKACGNSKEYPGGN